MIARLMWALSSLLEPWLAIAAWLGLMWALWRWLHRPLPPDEEV